MSHAGRAPKLFVCLIMCVLQCTSCSHSTSILTIFFPLTQVTNYLFPIWTYSYLSLLCPIFLLTDFLRYKPIIVTQGLFLVINYVLLCFANSLTAMTYLQFNFAMVTSTEVGYFSYIYSVIPPERYQQATGYVRSAMLTGYTFGATLGQLLISLADTSYFHINTITLGLMGVALLISLSLPMPKKRLFFKSGVGVSLDTLDEEASEGGKDAKERYFAWENLKRSGKQLWECLRVSYSSMKMLKWSLWWALATAGYGQVFNYVQLMWDHIEPSSTSSVYNGGVEAVCTLVGEAFCRTRLNHLLNRNPPSVVLLCGLFPSLCGRKPF